MGRPVCTKPYGPSATGKPLAIDLFSGLGGWTEGLLAEGYTVIGFDIERHDYGSGGYPGQLVLQDILTIHGSQFRNADVIVASPPCQEFSFMAMPFSRGKRIAAALRGQGEFPEGYRGSRTIEDLTRLFGACFRIQREAIEAAGHFIPLIVENVRGAQPWVGRSKYNYGSFHLWGDVPALMPATFRATPQREGSGAKSPLGNCVATHWKDRPVARYAHPTPEEMERQGLKVPGLNFHEHEKTGKPGRSFQSAAVEGTTGLTHHNRDSFLERAGMKVSSEDGGRRADVGKKGARFQQPRLRSGGTEAGRLCKVSSKSSARKAASAKIAMIPFALSNWIARCYYPA